MSPSEPAYSLVTQTIGPAGENQVGFALISCEYNRQAGRGGAGAVMGAKNLKAIVVRGTRGVPIADPERALQRRDYVLGRMAKLGFIDAQAHQLALFEQSEIFAIAACLSRQSPVVGQFVLAAV